MNVPLTRMFHILLLLEVLHQNDLNGPVFKVLEAIDQIICINSAKSLLDVAKSMTL